MSRGLSSRTSGLHRARAPSRSSRSTATTSPDERPVKSARHRTANGLLVVPAPPSLSVPLALAIPLVLVALVLPVALLRPLPAPLVTPSRRLLVAPLLPVPRGHGVVHDRHPENGPRDVLRLDQDPGTVVSAGHVPRAVGEGPGLAVVEEDVGLDGRGVAHGGNTRDDHELGW